MKHAIIFVLTCSIAYAACMPSTILFCDDFETGEPQPQWVYLTGYSYSSQVQSDVVRSGNYAHMMTLIRADTAGWSPERAEMNYENANTGRLGDTRWYSFSVYIPSDYIADESINREIFWQLLMHPYVNDQQKSPQFAFQIQADEFQIHNRHSVGGSTTNTITDTVYQAPMSGLRGRWTEWVVYAKWSAGSDGRLKVWRNGNLVVDKSGANAYAGTGNKYFEHKFGIYKWSWDASKYPDRPTNVDQRIIYHDNFKIGGPDATYEDMTGTVSSSCPDGQCNAGEDCSSCPSDCKCTGLCCNGDCTMPVCSSGTDCPGDACATTVCNNPGTCTAACSVQPVGCADGDSCCPTGCAGLDSDCEGVCPNTLALFHFDDDLLDSSGYSNIATCSSCPSTVNGKFSAGLEFNNNYLTISGGTKDAYPFTVSFWFKTTNSGTIFSYREDPKDTDYFIVSIKPDGTIQFKFATYSGELGDMTSTGSFNDGQWHHTAAVWDGYRMGRLYVDGLVDGMDSDDSGNAKAIDVPHVIEVGRNAYTQDDYFIGELDELVFWNHALSPVEVSAISQQAVCNLHPADTDKSGIIELDELIAFMVLWRNNEIEIQDLIGAIIVWKS